MDWAHDFFQAFIPLFVAIDPVGLVPLFIGVTGRMTDARRRRVSFEAVATATVLVIGFMFAGEAAFRFIGIADYDFRIGGGILLLVLAVYDLCIPGKPSVAEEDMVGIVPLAMPMIAGPATLTTVLVLQSRFGPAMVTLALAANFGLLLALLLASGRIARVVGPAALRGLSKVVMVLLAAIAVFFIRTGIMQAMGK
ncbi:MAG TPA: MarC family protein [Humisphaera sp.]